MSSQKFSAAEREAVWRAYGQKCVYSRRLLDVANLHIDHLVPETLAGDPIELAKTLATLGLDGTFDIYGWENLVPCLPEMNLQKGSLVFEPSHVRYFLGIAAARKAAVLEELKKIERRDTRGKAIIRLQQALASGKLTAEEVAKILQEHNGEPERIFELLVAMEFVASSDIRTVGPDELENLLDQPLRFGPNDHIEGVELRGDGEQKRFCKTCREYDAAKSEGFFPYTNYDIKVAIWFERQCGLLRALKVADVPTQSFISKPKVGILDLDLLPFSLFPTTPDRYNDTDSGTYQQRLDSGELVVKRLSGNSLTIQEPEGFGQVLIEVTRADFNGDGVEDILLFELGYATHGTMSWGGVKIITRLAADALFSEVKITG